MKLDIQGSLVTMMSMNHSTRVPPVFYDLRPDAQHCTWNVFVTILLPPDFISMVLSGTCASLLHQRNSQR
jgi:hypothetical protein